MPSARDVYAFSPRAVSDCAVGLTALSIRFVDPLRAVHILLLFVNYVLRRSKAVNLMHTPKARDFDCRIFKPLKDLVQGSSGALPYLFACVQAC